MLQHAIKRSQLQAGAIAVGVRTLGYYTVVNISQCDILRRYDDGETYEGYIRRFPH